MELLFCPRRNSVAVHDKVKTVWFNYRAGLFECLDNRCKGRFTETEIVICNKKLGSNHPKIQIGQRQVSEYQEGGMPFGLGDGVGIMSFTSR